MAAIERPEFNDGIAPTEGDFDQLALGVDALLQELVGLCGSGLDPDLGGLGGYTVDVLPNAATDKGGASLPTLGFLGPSLRVVRIDATHIRVLPGVGFMYRTSGVPSGESNTRVVRLGAAAPEYLTGLTVASLPTSGQFKRAIVSTVWRDVSVTATRQYIDTDGNPSSQSVPVRVKPEVGAVDASSGITITYGTAAGSAAAATRPATPAEHVVLAELLLDSTGLSATANVDGNTVGVTDLRPRWRPSKAGGGYDSRRATCSMDEATGARNVHRMGAKAVGVERVEGWVNIATGAAAVVTLDTSRDYRDHMIHVRFHALADVGNIPGGASDVSYTRNTNASNDAVETTGQSGIGFATWYAKTGSTDGSSGPRSGVCKTDADDAGTSLIFFVDDVHGYLKCRGLAGGTFRELYFVAEATGPLGRRPGTGMES